MKSLMRLILCLVVMLWAASAQAITLVSEDFDDGCAAISARWPDKSYVGFPCGGGEGAEGATTIVTSPVINGPGALRQNFTGTQYDNPPHGGGAAQQDFGAANPGYRDVWITWYSRMSTGFITAGGAIGGAGTKSIYLYMLSPSTGKQHGWVPNYMWGSRNLSPHAQGIRDAHPIQGGPIVPYDSEVFYCNVQCYWEPDNQWTGYEMHYKLNTPGQSDGLLEVYVTPEGGSTFLMTRYSNREFVDPNNSGSMPGDSYWKWAKLYRQDGLGYLYWDKLRITTERIGFGGTPPPPPPDTTPPAQVTGLSHTKTSNSITYTWNANTEPDLADYVVRGCQGGGCTPQTLAVVGASQRTYTRVGLTPNTLYRFNVFARDNASPQNAGTPSTTLDVTTDAASALPTVTGFAVTATGGQVTYTGTPTDFRFNFGGPNADGTWWASEIIRTLAQVAGGALNYIWPSTTQYACAHARDGVGAEHPTAFVCGNPPPTIPGGTTNDYLRPLASNPRWLTKDGLKGYYAVGISGGTNCNASFCGHQDLGRGNFINLIPSTTIIDTFDGTSSDIGSLWTGGYTSTVALTKNSGQVYESVDPGDGVEARSELLPTNQFAQATLGTTWANAGFIYTSPMVRMSEPGGAQNGYACSAILNGGGQTSRIGRVDNQITTVLVSENATTWAPGNVIRCRVIGNTVYLDRSTNSGATWTNLLSTTDATYKTGKVGLMMNTQTTASNGAATEFRAGPIVADVVTNLDAILAEGSNLVRYWTLEQSAWGSDAQFAANTNIRIPFTQFPWQWTGTTRTDTSTGTSIAVGVYDLDTPNQDFYDRAAERADAALSRGILPIFTMFSGGHLLYGLPPTWNAGFSHPFYAGNNINGISCDTNANEACEEAHSTANANILAYQLGYVCRLVQALGNRAVIYEVSNEDQTDSTAWQNAVMEQVRTCETTYGLNQHPIFQSGWGNSTNYPGGFANSNHLFSNTRNSIVSPLCTSDGTNWDTNPPANDGTKVIFYDSDHTGYNDTCGTWTRIVPWKLFTRAIYTIYLSERESAGVQTEIKTAMAQTLSYANRINLATAYPETGTSIFSTGYGLFTGTNSTTPNCSEYIMLMPSDGSSTINLTGCPGGSTFNVEYLNLTTGAVTTDGTVAGGASRSFNPAGSEPMVVYLKLNSVTDTTPPTIISCQTSPAGVLPAGTTSVDIVCSTNENATVKMDSDPDIAYASQDTTFGTTGGVSHSTSVGSLTNGNSYNRYIRASDGTNATTTDYPVSWSVAADPVSTPPADVTGLRGTLNEVQGSILWEWDQVPGATNYTLEISEGETFLVSVNTASATTSYVQSSLTVGSYVGRIKAKNSANQESVNWHTSQPVLATLPPTITGLVEPNPGAYSNTVVLSWTAPTNSNLVAVFTRGTGSSCVDADFTTVLSGSAVELRDATVAPSTTYCYRGKFSNPVLGGSSVDWSSTLYATTRSAGGGTVSEPRISVPFGGGISSPQRLAAPQRLVRPE